MAARERPLQAYLETTNTLDRNRMKYFVMLGGERKGPYTLGQMQAMWNAGTLTSETLFWQEGLSSWEPVSAIQSDLEAAPQPAPIVASGQPPQPTPPAQHDQIIYADESVTVTTNRVSIQGTTYALRNITSVKMEATKPGFGCAVVPIVLGVLILIGSVVGNSLFVAVFIGGVPVAVGVFLLLTRKPIFHVRISSASGEVKALSSQDQVYIERIVKSINAAIVKCR